MDQNLISFRIAASIWWSFFWRAVLVTGLVGIIVGWIHGTFPGLPFLGGSADIELLFVGLALIPVSIWALMLALKLQHNNYIIRLVRLS